MIRIFMIGFSNEKGGVESYIRNISEQLDHSEYEIVLSLPEIVIDGKRWKRPADRHNYIHYYLFWRLFFLKNHFDVLYLNECDIVSIDYLKFAKSAGVPVRIIHSHSTGSQLYMNKKKSLFHCISEKHNRKVLDNYATNLFACSKDAGDWMFNGRTYAIIKNGISLSKYQYCKQNRDKIRAKYGLNNSKTVGVIGRISAPKNPLFSVRIIEELSINEPNMRAVFIGDGEMRKETENAVRKCNLDSIVKFIGAVDNVNEWMSAIDVLLMPSLFEAIPFVLIEAQAAGLPCVVSAEVSSDANITGELIYVGLDELPIVWAQKVIDAFSMVRKNNKSALINAGYSIEDTANKVSNIIEKAMGIRC